jgi:dienelactone hydrolase
MRLALLTLVTACAGPATGPGAVAPQTATAPVAANGPVSPPVNPHAIRGAEHVAFASLDADLTHGAPTTLDAWIMRPATPGPHPAMLLLHGCAGLFAASGELTARHRDWAERLVAEGYVVLLPDSFSGRGLSEICSRSPQPVRPGYERTRDAYAALAFLEHQPDVDPARVGVLGWSNGGSTVLDALAPHIRARPPGLAHDFKLAIAFYPGCERVLARGDWLPPVAPVHVLIGASDDWTVPGPCVDLIARARAAGADADIVVYPDAFHDFDDPQMHVHVRGNVATTANHTATIGMNPAARADAIARVTGLLRAQL